MKLSNFSHCRLIDPLASWIDLLATRIDLTLFQCLCICSLFLPNTSDQSTSWPNQFGTVGTQYLGSFYLHLASDSTPTMCGFVLIFQEEKEEEDDHDGTVISWGRRGGNQSAHQIMPLKHYLMEDAIAWLFTFFHLYKLL